jgi:hypothetical protein
LGLCFARVFALGIPLQKSSLHCAGVSTGRIYAIFVRFKMPGGNNVVLVGTADPGTGDPRSMFFSNDELRALVARGEMRALPVWLEHGDASKEQVGQVEYAWVAPDGMHVLISLDVSLIRSRAIVQWISGGIFCGLSLGYRAQIDKAFNVCAKTIHEISIVRDPYHKSCVIDFVGELPVLQLPPSAARHPGK